MSFGGLFFGCPQKVIALHRIEIYAKVLLCPFTRQVIADIFLIYQDLFYYLPDFIILRRFTFLSESLFTCSRDFCCFQIDEDIIEDLGDQKR